MNPSTALATVVVDELVRHGVREAVLCPGSRSAAFAYSLQEADRAGRLRLHVRVDERSAGFLALGLAKLTRRPVPVFTTSGTAVANLHPAVLEASHAAVPLIIVSADRPSELQGTGANQTTDQNHLFGTAVRMFHLLGAPQRREGQNAVWRSVVSRLYAAAIGASGPDAGPVHLNVQLREPLVPDLEPVGGWPESLDGRDDAAAWVRVQPSSPRVQGLACIPRTLVVLGDLPDPAMTVEVTALGRASGWPVIAEPFGAHDRGALVPHGPLLLTAGQWLGRHLPDRVLVVGRITLSRPVGDLLRNPAVKVEIVAAQSNWPDPWHVASVVHPFGAVSASIPNGRQVDERWAQEWANAGELVAGAAEAIIEQAWPSGLVIAATVLAELPSEATLFVGSSNSARDVDLAMSASARGAPLTVVASRGLGGIDGCVSTAVGLALAQPQRPAYALMGDLTFLHDSNGLLIGPLEPRPDLTIVVTNDDGGGIFTLLEPGEPSRATDFERVFGTPTGASIADICRAHGVAHTLASTRADLRAALRQHPDGLGVVEVRV
ncbi:MAG: 2-succinyl-5-enolpyruvyl-6-hydroxy-3-cyclohexene-1-carboxylic-acid synthase, partial [Actinobacteria bacterium]|nr:2-succinyl-5-enolpyruvyl-6-hydroxy-3-cyclohexene-1-carboxylic-acid synthase [Actinomycetota bacterium]